MSYQIYFASYSSDGNENWRVPVGPICSVDDYVTYLEGSDYYLFWVDEDGSLYGRNRFPAYRYFCSAL